jgi:hypothetical protein
MPIILATQEAEIKEDRSLKPVQANSSRNPHRKKHHKCRAGGVAQGVGPEFKLQFEQKTIKNKNK